MRRYDRMHYIETLDPDRDYEEIFRLITRYEFPWDYNTGYSFALVTDYVIPSISQTLAITGEFAHHGMKRFDDTMLFFYEAHWAGLESEHGRNTLRALNKIHGKYQISNQDYLHILAGHLISAIDWINAYGWRRLSSHEVRAMVNTYRRLGELMGIKGIPENHAEFRAFLARDIAERGAWHYANAVMVGTALRVIAGLCPHGTKAIGTKAILALIDEPIRVMLGQARMPSWFSTAVKSGLRIRGKAVRLLPPRRMSRPYIRRPLSYPQGWTLDQLGPVGRTGARYPSA